MTSRLLYYLAATTALMAPVAAQAGKPDGKIQVKLLGTAVLPDGGVTSIDKGSLPAGSDTRANDNAVPTLAVEYFFTPNISAETICCLTKHHVDGRGALAGLRLVDDYLILPATVTVKYHLTGLGPVKPYVGAGPSWFISLDSKAGAGAVALGLTRAKISSKFGAALQAGFDVAVNDKGLGLTFDAKRYFMRPAAHFYTADGTEAIATRHKLDPWVLSGGVAYRF
jgi:outer membrane protein